MNKLLWVAPNLNHYKVRFMKKLQDGGELKLLVFAGGDLSHMGHANTSKDTDDLQVERVKVAKPRFSKSLKVYKGLFDMLRRERPEFMIMPNEYKFLPLVLYAFFLRFFFNFSLIAYTHPLVSNKNVKHRLTKLMTWFMFSFFDRVIFYTEMAMRYALDQGLVPESKAAFANNTLDTDSIKAVYDYVPPPEKPSILFIGRLIPSKRVDVLLEYYRELKKRLPALTLTIIGDGPEASLVKSAADKDPGIHWKGAVVDEAAIAPIMRCAQVVFLPGLSGLSIVHAFCYGRPFATIENENHGPEIAYMKDEENGLVLEGDSQQDVERLSALLTDRQRLERYARNAFQTSEALSIDTWCEQMTRALATAGKA